jgi:hypothetical protein
LRENCSQSPLKSRIRLALTENLQLVQLTNTGRLGSLYFKDSDIPGCEPAIITSGPQDIVGHIESTYCIGPITRREFWEKQRSDMQYHGPCTWLHVYGYLGFKLKIIYRDICCRIPQVHRSPRDRLDQRPCEPRGAKQNSMAVHEPTAEFSRGPYSSVAEISSCSSIYYSSRRRARLS